MVFYNTVIKLMCLHKIFQQNDANSHNYLFTLGLSIRSAKKDHLQCSYSLKLLRWNEEQIVLVRSHSLCQAKTGKPCLALPRGGPIRGLQSRVALAHLNGKAGMMDIELHLSLAVLYFGC